MNEETTVEETNEEETVLEEAHEDPVEAEEAVEVVAEVCKCWPSVKQNGLCPH